MPEHVPLEHLSYHGGYNLETILCPLCGSTRFKRLVVEQHIPVVRCRNCSLVFANPRPDSAGLKHFYSQYYPTESAPLWQKQMSEIFYEEGLKMLQALESAKKIALGDPPTVLDIGCGMGFFLALMQQEGWETWGIEPSSEAALYARKELHLKIYEGILDDFPGGHQYDVVTLWYVLEHVPNPMDVLKRAWKLLKPEGLLIVRVPNQSARIDVWLSRLGLSRFFLMNPPRHLFDYSPTTISMFLKQSGFGHIMIKNGLPRKTGTLLERLRRKLWNGFFDWVYQITRGKVIGGSSMTIYARKIEPR